jgi:hypothetical protein
LENLPLPLSDEELKTREAECLKKKNSAITETKKISPKCIKRETCASDIETDEFFT